VHFRKYGHAAVSIIVPGPPETRAKWRTKKARELFNDGILNAVHWDMVLSSDMFTYDGRVSDPFMTEPLAAATQDILHPIETKE
jgi:hypothetical protein